jgi:hypothetical protein
LEFRSVPRDRNLAAGLWSRQSFVGLPMAARVLFVAMQNFADDHGVQPYEPCSIRLRVFPGDRDIEDAQVQALIEELVSRKLLAIYEVDSESYVRIVDWNRMQRVGKRARRLYPRDPALPPEPVAEPAPAPRPAAPPPTVEEEAHGVSPEMARWRKSIVRSLRPFMPGSGPPADTEIWIKRWMADGCDLKRDVLPAIIVACRPSGDGEGPPGLAAVAAYVEANRERRLAVESASLTA